VCVISSVFLGNDEDQEALQIAENLLQNSCCTNALIFRLAVKKFDHPAGMKKIKLEKVKRNKPKITKIVLDKMRNREIAANVKVGDVSVEGMMALPKVGTLL